MEPSCQIDTELLIHIQIFHLKTKMEIETTKLRQNVQSPQDRTSVEPNTNPTENTQLNPILIEKPSHSEISTEQKQNPSVELQQQFWENSHWSKFKLKMNGWDYDSQKRLECTNQQIKKQGLERSQLLQQIIQPDSEIQDETRT